jgi:hypothetical protein
VARLLNFWRYFFSLRYCIQLETYMGGTNHLGDDASYYGSWHIIVFLDSLVAIVCTLLLQFDYNAYPGHYFFMSEKLGENLSGLLSQGVIIETSSFGRCLSVSKLDLQTAVRLGHALTIALDDSPRWRMYTASGFSLEDNLSRAKELASNHENIIFGETRPADRNLAVRVERERQSFSLIADVRNDYEDRPELEGGRILQLGFVAAINALEL